jgi:hypothetical protein
MRIAVHTLQRAASAGSNLPVMIILLVLAGLTAGTFYSNGAFVTFPNSFAHGVGIRTREYTSRYSQTGISGGQPD